MNALTDFPDTHETPVMTRSSLAVSETYWGYIVSETGPEDGHWSLRQMLCIFLGVVFFLVAFGLWVVPGANVSTAILPIKLALTAVFAGTGGLFLHTGTRGQGRHEVHVDTTLSEMRFVARSANGAIRLTHRVNMADIDSIYVTSDTGEGAPAHLLVQEGAGENPLHVATGAKRELRMLRDRMKRDLRPAAERVERRLMRQARESMAGLG